MASKRTPASWEPGVSGNPKGMPKNPKRMAYTEILMTRCTLEEWAQIVNKAIDQAKDGNAAARRWLAGYLIGMPKQRVEMTGADGSNVTIDVEFKAALDKIYGDPE